MATAQDVWRPLVEQVHGRTDYEREMHAYYQAEQDLPLNEEELNSKFGTSFAGFRDNLARPIIETAEGRVRIQDFSNSDAVDIYLQNDLDAESKYLHTDAMVMGRSFAIVLKKADGTAGIWPQQTSACAILYAEDDPRTATAGMKWWSEQMDRPNQDETGETQSWRVRVNLYFEDRIERYVSTRTSRALEGNFDKYEPYETETVPWTSTHEVGEVPMFEFKANFDMTTQECRSDLHDGLPLIDSINKTFLDMMVASEFTAAPQRWATGVEIPLDPQSGRPMQTFKSGADELWTAANESAKFGQFTPGQLTSYKAAIDTLVDHLVYVTRTPKYALAGESKYSSGENLRIIENPLRSRVSDHQEEFTNVWQKIMAAALRLENKSVDSYREIEVLWLPANAPFFTEERLAELKLKVETAGIPQEQIWREMGYTEQEIDAMKDMRDEEAALGFDVADAAAQFALTGEAQNEPPAGLAPEA